MMTQYQRLKREELILDQLGYKAVAEETYTKNSSSIVEWTKFFEDRAYTALDYAGFHITVPRSKEKAVAVATQWYQFSSFMPYFLCQAAAFMSTNEKRHYVIQTAFEELGMRDVNEIHPEMFKACCVEGGVPEELFTRFAGHAPVQELLDRLRVLMVSSQNDDYIMGMLLGLELPAEDNISSVFHSVSFNDMVEARVKEHVFFRLHMALECEHVRLTVSNFLRFCETDAQKEAFVAGFDEGIRFWVDFWQSLADLALGLKIVAKQV